MNSIIEFENAIMNAALNVETEEDSEKLLELISEQQNWFVSLGEEEMKRLYPEYEESHGRVLDFLSDLKKETMKLLSSAERSHTISNKYRLYD